MHYSWLWTTTRTTSELHFCFLLCIVFADNAVQTNVAHGLKEMYTSGDKWATTMVVQSNFHTCSWSVLLNVPSKSHKAAHTYTSNVPKMCVLARARLIALDVVNGHHNNYNNHRMHCYLTSLLSRLCLRPVCLCVATVWMFIVWDLHDA